MSSTLVVSKVSLGPLRRQITIRTTDPIHGVVIAPVVTDVPIAIYVPDDV